MKKLFTIVAVAGMLAFYACGPSAEEKAAMQKAQDDSVAAAQAAQAEAQAAMEKAKQDSMMAADAAAKEKAMQDSIAAAEANKGKKGKK